MTLIAFNTTRERAEVLTDTLAYSPNFRHMGHSAKVVQLPHIDAVATMTGDNRFGAFFKSAVIGTGMTLPTFDALVEWLPGQLREILAGFDGSAGHYRPTPYLVGYSHERKGFAAYAFHISRDFEPLLIEGAYMTPMPTIFRPHEMNLAEYAEDLTDPEAAARLEEWSKAPAMLVPDGREDWITLAAATRRSRSAWWSRSNLAVHPVAGALHLTTVERGKITTEHVHTFDDSGEEFANIIRGSAHPQSQLGPCPCGSGKTFLSCHLEPLLDDACTCGSGEPFRGCCMVSAEESEHVA